jgi:hypothetical protein
MAGRRKKGAPIVALDSDEAYQAAIEQSTRYLTVVDIHQGWCGPCTTMEPIYNKACVSGIGRQRGKRPPPPSPPFCAHAPAFAKRLMRPQPQPSRLPPRSYIELDKAEERLKFFTIDAEKLSAESKKGLPVTESCKPLFVVFKVRVALLIFCAPRARSHPLRPSPYRPQNKAPVTKVLGALAPELETSIMDNVPEVPKEEE